MNQTSSVMPSRPRRRFVRFGLLELLLVTGVVAAWLPFIIAKQKIPKLRAEVEMMRGMTSQLVRSDDTQLWVRQIPSVLQQINGWKYYLPSTANVELRFATDGINSFGMPTDFQAVKLPAGEHSIFLESTKNDAEGYVDEIYIDDALVLTSKHPASWLKSSGSSWGQDITRASAAYDLAKPIALKRCRYSVRYPIRKWFSQNPPDEYDSKGACLWISPPKLVPAPAPIFLSPQTPNFRRSAWGHRQGMRLMSLSFPGSRGFLGVKAGKDAIIGDDHSQSRGTNLISLRPITEQTNIAEVPESQFGQFNRSVGAGLKIAMSNSLVPPTSMQRYSHSPTDVHGAISEDGQSMSVFCHYESFASGAQPILEVIFDANYPDRIGFLPHQASGSQPMTACQLVTTMDARYLHRQIDVLSGSSLIETINFQKLKSESQARSDWKTILLTQLPVSKADGSYGELSICEFSTDVQLFDKVKYSVMTDSKWQYKGIANRQRWLLPKGEKSDRPPEIAIRPAKEFPSSVTPPVPTAIPGGPVIGNVRITIPMPASKPIWLEIVPEG